MQCSMIQVLHLTGQNGQAMRLRCELTVPHTGGGTHLPPMAPDCPTVLGNLGKRC